MIQLSRESNGSRNELQVRDPCHRMRNDSKVVREIGMLISLLRVYKLDFHRWANYQATRGGESFSD